VTEIIKKTGKQGRRTIIDKTLDQVYSVAYVDVNNKGKASLLVSNHEGEDSKAGVFTFEVPADLFAGAYKRHTIGTGFVNAWSIGGGNMAPGFPYAVKPNLKDNDSQLYVVIAGDGDNNVEMLRPIDTNLYNLETIKYEGGTVGSIAFADLNGDGWLEFFVPNYDDSYIEIFQFYDDANGVIADVESPVIIEANIKK